MGRFDDEAKVSAPTGTGKRVTFTGKIVSLKEKASYFGYRTTYVTKATIKMTTPEGVWLAWGTLPGALVEKARVGDTVTLTATLESGNEAHFCFFKRPTPIELVKAPERESEETAAA